MTVLVVAHVVEEDDGMRNDSYGDIDAVGEFSTLEPALNWIRAHYDSYCQEGLDSPVAPSRKILAFSILPLVTCNGGVGNV